MTTLDSYLIDDVIKVSVLLFRMELTLALAALRATLVQPLLYAIPMEDLLAIAALNRTERYAKAYGADKGVDEPTVLLFDILFAEPVRLFQHELYDVTIDSLD